MAKRCCCVIPLRGGSALIGLIIALVSILLLGLTFTKKNPMIMHLAIIHAALPWVYVIVFAASGVIGLYGILAGWIGKLPLMRLYKLLFWVYLFLFCIWQAVNFILSLVYRNQSIDSCEKNGGSAEKSTEGNKEVSVGGYTTTFLGMEIGDTYGLANCAQAAQADAIGNGIILFFGALFLFYFGTIISSYTRRLRERKLGHRLREDDEWNSNINDLTSAYRADAKAAPRYPLKPIKKKSGIMGKLKFGK
ncbi:unnamed protein product [Cunninghamella blakesleeana]